VQERREGLGGRLAGLRPRQVWGAGVLVAALGLLGIVAVAADGQPLLAPEASRTLNLGAGWQVPLAVLAVVALAGGLVIIVLGFHRQRVGKPLVRRRHAWLVWLASLAVGVVAFFLLRPNPADRQRPPEADDGSGAAAEQTVRRQPPPPWAVLALGGVVVAALTGAVLAGRRLARTSRPAAPDLAAGALAVLDRSLGELEESDDPRAAIIATYARLLDAFAERGLARRPAETPVEYLLRGLAALPIRPEPAARITTLFLEARFSTHPMGAAERDDARLALIEARDDLLRHPTSAEVAAT
jgi:hypothetical protein